MGAGVGAGGDSACCRARPASPPRSASRPARPGPRSATSSRPRASSSAARTGGTRGSRRPAPLPVDDVYGLACPSADQCAMVGTTWVGFPAVGAGAVAQSIDAGLTFRSSPTSYVPITLTAVACPSASGCVAVGGHTVARLTLLHPSGTQRRRDPRPGRLRRAPTSSRHLDVTPVQAHVRGRIPRQRGHTPVDSGPEQGCDWKRAGVRGLPSPERWRTVMPQTCPQCQSEAADDADYCPSCGAALSAHLDGHPGCSRRERSRDGRRGGAPAGAAAAGVRRAGLQVRRGPLVAGRPDRRGRHDRAVHLAVPALVHRLRIGFTADPSSGSVRTGGSTSC